MSGLRGDVEFLLTLIEERDKRAKDSSEWLMRHKKIEHDLGIIAKELLMSWVTMSVDIVTEKQLKNFAVQECYRAKRNSAKAYRETRKLKKRVQFLELYIRDNERRRKQSNPPEDN